MLTTYDDLYSHVLKIIVLIGVMKMEKAADKERLILIVDA
jgi:hypothetical protein